jgi:hypothetical protein
METANKDKGRIFLRLLLQIIVFKIKPCNLIEIMEMGSERLKENTA